MINVYYAQRDHVIRSTVAVGATTYEYALEHLVPLLNRFQHQRKIQGRAFYARLKKDILRGCIMPPITLAFVKEDLSEETDIRKIDDFIRDNIESGYILDGMQRLNTLQDASTDSAFSPQRSLFVNVIVAERYDLLLYRMVTLNNGQKPMTARHQIEMLTEGLIDAAKFGFSVVTEKETEGAKPKGAFRMADLSAAYMAFVTNSLHNQNSRIVETKLDEILANRLMDSNLADEKIRFSDVLSLVDIYCHDDYARDWLRNQPNLIGFAVGSKISIESLQKMSAENFSARMKVFEEAFESIEISKVNVGKFRRELSKHFIENIEKYKDADPYDIVEDFVEITLAE